MRDLLVDAALRAARYLETIRERRVAPDQAGLDGLAALARPLQDDPLDAARVLAELDAHGSPGTMGSAGPRYFGFVVGGSLPATVAAGVLATGWDQNGGLEATSPAAAAIEHVAREWLVDALGLTPGTEVGFVTGATMANLSALAAARHAVLEARGWDVEARGLFGAPPITVVVGHEVHISLIKALGLVGLGRDRVVRVPVDGQGRFRDDLMPVVKGPTIVCLQAGNVNTGAFDPIEAVADRIDGTGAWLHVDAAYGLWAAASPALRPLTAGVARADSLAADAHKWLNVPYDSGLVFVRNPRPLNAAMVMNAAYLVEGVARDPAMFTPEMSRRARGVEVWAGLRALGRRGLAELVERNCRQARRFAEGLAEAGHEVLNEVVLNQVLVSFGDADRTRKVIAGVQQDGACWCGGTVWQGRTAMRISVSSWATTDEDVERSLAAILRVAAELRPAGDR